MNNIKNESIFSADDLTANDASSVVQLGNAEMGSIQISATIATGDVTFQLQLSNIENSDGTSVWTDDGSSINMTGDDNAMIKLSRDQLGAQRCRVSVTHNSGTIDSINMRVNLKGSS